VGILVKLMIQEGLREQGERADEALLCFALLGAD